MYRVHKFKDPRNLIIVKYNDSEREVRLKLRLKIQCSANRNRVLRFKVSKTQSYLNAPAFRDSEIQVSRGL